MSVKTKLQQKITQRLEAQDKKRLQQNPVLWRELNDYISKTKSTGCSYSIYWSLYEYVRAAKPVEILECGTGITTVILAQALSENEAEGHPRGRITSMEENSFWFEMARTLLPERLATYVEIVHSPKVEDYYSMFHGVRYEELPERRYDLVFVDGPETRTDNGTIVCNLDYITVVKNSDTPVPAIVQGRLINSYVYQKVFGVEKVRINAGVRITHVAPCSKHDLHAISGASSDAFAHSLRLFGRTELKLKMETEAVCAKRRQQRIKQKELPYQSQESSS